MTDVDWTFQLAEQLDWHWRAQLRPRLNGLTDEEYRWEPVPGAWNVRPRGTGTAPIAVGAGEFTIDFAMPEPDPSPVTTIAWRLGHIIVGVLGMRVASHFGGPPCAAA
jgi:DinB superfamily